MVCSDHDEHKRRGYANQENSSATPAEAGGPHSEHQDGAPDRKDEVGESALALGLQQPQVGMGAGALERLTTMRLRYNRLLKNSLQVGVRKILAV